LDARRDKRSNTFSRLEKSHGSDAAAYHPFSIDMETILPEEKVARRRGLHPRFPETAKIDPEAECRR